MSKQRDEEYTLADVSERLDRAIELMEQFIAAQTRDTRRTRANGKGIDWNAPRRRTLADECTEIAREARRTQEAGRGVGPGGFRERLLESSDAYREFTNENAAAIDFETQAREMGARMRGETFEDTLKRYRCGSARASDAIEEDDWATMMNKTGAALRKQ